MIASYDACDRWLSAGVFFELQGHGIEHQCMHDLFAAQRAFFALPEAQKLSLGRTAINARGYNSGELTKNSLDAKVPQLNNLFNPFSTYLTFSLIIFTNRYVVFCLVFSTMDTTYINHKE